MQVFTLQQPGSTFPQQCCKPPPTTSLTTSQTCKRRKYSCLRSSASDHANLQQSILENQRADTCRSRRALGLAALSTLPISALVQAGPASAAADTLPPNSSPIPEGEAFSIKEADVAQLSASERQVYALNRRIQLQNRVPPGFPGFIRKGFDVLVVGDDYSTAPSGLIYKDFQEGQGPLPTEGQEVVFHYNGYNESGALIDSSYRKGRPAQTRLGVAGLIPGFEEGVRGMRIGQQRRIIVPPALGPPVGPSTFFSAKQCEVFDVELLAIRSCTRRQVAMFSDVVCSDI
ncbi:hypothetical protein DUNSADRAFT_7550 [Dunaliella salina]|uniref:peptidylprolyl isomerase n=1 Tax=Dunaliella salina TaxID=3046 RepID=A0ABQ7GL31_DUNSA|nr:hypothetical protein DUNSADRAFT_7550 [Dunaliella salina]|eukprot:KAF5835318.1 hypothetical protein DUNSADRAFT_7550 [Dunaliella salina]